MERTSITVRPRAPERIWDSGVFPYLFRAHGGTLAVAVFEKWERSERDQAIAVGHLVCSRDGGRSWAELVVATPEDYPAFEGSAIELKDGRILLFHYDARSRGQKGVFLGKLYRSDDGLRTLSPPETVRFSVPRAVGGHDDNGVPLDAIFIHRSVLEQADGSLILSAYGWFEEDNQASEYRSTMSKFRAMLLRSGDLGLSWEYVSTIASGPVGQEGFNEPVIVRLTRGRHAGRLVCLMRTGRENPIYQAESDDDGKTWGAPRELSWVYSRFGRSRPIVGTDPDLTEMADGTLVLSFGHKPDYRDDGIFLAFSLDQGSSWTEVTRLSSSPTCAYTSVREISPGVLFVTYSARAEDIRPLPGVHYHNYRTVGQVVEVRVERLSP